MNDLYWLALSRLPGVGGMTIKRLLARFGTVEAVLGASDEELLRVPRITAVTLTHLQQTSLAALQTELAQLAQNDIHILTWEHDAYPANLRTVADAPPVLYRRGTLRPGDGHAAAIVGTRRPTPEAVAAAQQIAYELAQRGLTIVSGLALGVDTAVHRGALMAENGRTIAVLGSGLQRIYPPQNGALAEQICQRGVLLSERRPLAQVSAPDLAARNRVISGLATAVLVIQSPRKGGAMITAQKAEQQGRLLMAVPGSPGTDQLIQKGAVSLDLAIIDFDQLAHTIRSYKKSETSQPRLL
jgi:DNA processing protein